MNENGFDKNILKTILYTRMVLTKSWQFTYFLNPPQLAIIYFVYIPQSLFWMNLRFSSYI